MTEEDIRKAKSPTELSVRFNRLYEKSRPDLTQIEISEKRLSEDAFASVSNYDGTLSKLMSLIAKVMPTWKDELNSDEPPCVLIISYSANRCVDLIKAMAPIRTKSTIAKLFARHIKETDQLRFLSTHKTVFSVGTPGRILSLLRKDGMNSQRIKFIIIDTHKDIKQRSILDISETRKDLLAIIYTHDTLFKRLQQGDCKLVLF